jgi:WD40 repeat protein
VLALEGLTEKPAAAPLSPDGRYLLTVGSGARVEVRATEKGMESRATTGNTRDRVLTWDAATGRRLQQFGPEEVLAHALWGADSRRVYLFGQRGGRIWDALEGKKLADLEGESMPRAALSPDGKRLVGYYHFFDKDRLHAIIWDADSGKKLTFLQGHEQEITAAAFSPDSRLIVTMSADATVRVWDAATAEPRQILRSHRGPVRAASFSADGRWLVTASDDGTARIWNAVTWEEWLTLAGHAGPVYAAKFRPNGEQVMTASRDGTARVWPVDPLPAARQRRPRELSEEDRQRLDIATGPAE